MSNLLDTHTLIWFLNGDNQLSEKARKTIESNPSKNFISIASLWEIAIKVNMNRLEMNVDFEQISNQLIQNNFQLLPISFEDLLILTKLPFYHRDPFDRIIISQGISTNLSIVSKDKVFEKYDVKLVW